jgi:hypothetical protein
MSYRKLISKPNLHLAWRRITSTRDARYKKYFRHLYEAYELTFEHNITDLHKRLRDEIYFPTEPVRIYYPKPSGLQRPITLLCIEDQILLQAIANLFSEKLYVRRKPLLGVSVFSNWENDKKDSIFFVQHWKNGYYQLRKSILQSFATGKCWIAKVDLSAFYETVPHELLLRTAFSQGGGVELSEHTLRWLEIWSSDCHTSRHHHGIPQGPAASDFLAECMLLPIDEQMVQKHSYFRYVDDTWLLGDTELDVRHALVQLDVLCRERGLIPNTDKMRIRKVKGPEELVADIANIAHYSEQISYRPKRFLRVAEKTLDSAIARTQNGLEVLDRTQLRYIYFRSPASDKLLNAMLELWERYPEHVDAFGVFLENYERAESVIHLCRKLILQDYPYDYVRGEAWALLARMLTPREISRDLIEMAVVAAKDKDKKHIATRMGAYAFLCQCEVYNMGSYSKWMMWEESPIVQSLLAPSIDVAHGHGYDTIRQILGRSIPDPALALARNLTQSKVTLSLIGKNPNELTAVAQKVFQFSGIISGVQDIKHDSMGKILASRYKIQKWGKWKKLFGQDYRHALDLLLQAERYYRHHPTTWLAWQASYNDALFRAFQRFLATRGSPGAILLADLYTGELYPIRNLLDNGKFKSIYPKLSAHLKAMNDRRNQSPQEHPYQKKTGIKAVPLRKREQQILTDRLQDVYNEIIRVTTSLNV